ncbi:hypothetical protein [Plasmodium yoelii yoelii]|uniref:Uncharacterized protein n=1 Tax=Plasmodium yoelii yoelii TaxID=73239 RepID=Q7REK9_PLAYO|nr:hypothetical protein [Plasmodium yoelii yoelii]
MNCLNLEYKHNIIHLLISFVLIKMKKMLSSSKEQSRTTELSEDSSEKGNYN